MLKAVYSDLLSHYEVTPQLTDKYWQELQTRHTEKHRAYHNLNHLVHLYEELLSIKNQVKEWDVLLLSIFYHDIIYDPKKSNNEEKSADLASQVLNQLGFPDALIAQVYQVILATKSHQYSENVDTNLFTDADISILGADQDAYLNYTKQIRKEYSIYPNFLYKKGRKKVLKHFISMGEIYKTSWFQDKYGEQALINLRRELESL